MINVLSQPNTLAAAVIQDQKASGTQGGTFTSGAWRTRDLNTEVSDPSGIVSIASNQFTLQPGRYLIEGVAPAGFVGYHQLRIRNITDGTTVATGGNSYSGASTDVTLATVAGVATITAATVFELQHYGNTTAATNGFGRAASWGTIEVYATVKIIKL